jgi:hypothetical protein
MARFAVVEVNDGRRGLALRYGVNTLGALAAREAAHGNPRGATAPFRLVLLAVVIMRFVFLLMELVRFPMLSPILLESDSAASPTRASAVSARPTFNVLALTCALEALLIALPYEFGDRLALASMLLQPRETLGFYCRIIA